MGRNHSRVKHKSGDLSHFESFNFLGNWRGGTMEQGADRALCLSFRPLDSLSGFFYGNF